MFSTGWEEDWQMKVDVEECSLAESVCNELLNKVLLHAGQKY